MKTAMERCAICQLPVAPIGIPWGYAGPVCQGHYYGQPMTPSEETIRRIVREELARARSPQSPTQEGEK